MSSAMKFILGVLLLLGVAAAGYWYGMQRTGDGGLGAEIQSGKKLLYYRNPMGLPDTSPVPKKDPMGMDYIPVYEGEGSAGAEGEVVIDPARLQKLGVTSEAVARRELKRELRLTGRIEADERRLYTIAPRFEGWVENLFANTTGQAVGKGQPLFEVYSPELVSAQREQELAARARDSLKEADPEARAAMERLARAGEERMRNWEVRPGDAGRAGRLVYRAPASGIVLEKKAVEGMRFMPGEMLYRIADLSSVWVIADVPEQDIGLVQPGSAAQISVDSFPERSFAGRVDFIYPTLNAMTRTVPVRIEIANPDGELRPAMFASARIAAGKGGEVLAVPDSAVIDSGTRQVVLVRRAEGRFEPRAVTLGARGDDHVEVLSGVTEGEQVVTGANFLIDAESNLKAALAGFGAHAAHGGESAKGETKPVGHQAQGVFKALNEDGSVSVTHDPIATLKWPAMTMDFALANSSLAEGIAPGSAISFEIVERGEGEWVITKLQAQAEHKGH